MVRLKEAIIGTGIHQQGNQKDIMPFMDIRFKAMIKSQGVYRGPLKLEQ